jgi:hypothetical protein
MVFDVAHWSCRCYRHTLPLELLMCGRASVRGRRHYLNCVRLQLIRCGRHSGSWRRCGESFHLWFTSIEEMES